jgi:predicted nucleic acid-binding Zn ribbon protein
MRSATGYDWEMDEESEEDLEEREAPDAEDADWNLDPAAEHCPRCGGDIVEDSQWCPHCKNYVSQEDAPRRKSWWVIAGVVVVIVLIVVLWR